MGLPKTLRGCWRCKSSHLDFFGDLRFEYFFFPVRRHRKIESFIPFWEWDLPKKKKRKHREGDSDRKKGKGKDVADSRSSTPARQAQNGEGGAHIEEVDTSGDSRPVSRGARVEDAPEDDE